MYLYRASDSAGGTVEFWFSEHRDLPASKRFFRKAVERHGRPERVVIDGSPINHEAIVSCDTENRLLHRSRRAPKRVRIRQSRYLTASASEHCPLMAARVEKGLAFHA